MGRTTVLNLVPGRAITHVSVFFYRSFGGGMLDAERLLETVVAYVCFVGCLLTKEKNDRSSTSIPWSCRIRGLQVQGTTIRLLLRVLTRVMSRLPLGRKRRQVKKVRKIERVKQEMHEWS